MAGVARAERGRGASTGQRAGTSGTALVLIGFMGAGKSTVARELAGALGVRALDSDALLEQRFGHSIATEFELRGEASFRAAEESVVCELLADAAHSAAPGPWTSVIALGGGSILSTRVRVALAGHLTVLLDIDPALAWARLQDASDRPLARDRDAFLALAAERRGLYEELADAFLPVPARGIAGAERAQRLVRALRMLAAAPRGSRLVWASAASGEYPVIVGCGLLRAGDGLEPAGREAGATAPADGSLRAVWPLDPSVSRPFSITDANVAGLYGARLERLGSLGATIAIEPGERHKSLASAERAWRALAAAGMTRADHIVALGGGVVGDLAGFCAATYQRGVPVVHVPTTLVAQVDSAYGGKTGVDLPDAKNYVGVYHQPAGVLADPDALATLPAPELAAGWVEVLKTALIAGGPLWERVSAGAPATDERTILDCARTKLAVVAADERDAGARQLLNLGHTVGHAIEAATGYTRYRHGEAVGLGLLAALRLSGAQELREQIRELLRARRLPVTLGAGDPDPEQIVSATWRDKKRRGSGSVPFVLVHAAGEVRFGCEIAESDLRAAVRELRSHD